MLRVRTVLSGWTGGPGVMTQYFVTPNQDTAAAERCRQYVHDLIGTAVALVLSNGVTWRVADEVDVVDPTNGNTTNTLIGSTAHTATGGGGASMAPLASGGLIHWRTDAWVAGRHVQGRTYVNPMAVAKVGAGGEMLGATQTSVNTALAAYISSLDAGDTQVVWKRPRLAKPDATPPVEAADGSVHDIVSADLASKLSVLTSRRD